MEKDAEDIIQNTEGKMESFLKRITKRTAAHTGPDAHAGEVERHPSRKRVKVTTQVKCEACEECNINSTFCVKYDDIISKKKCILLFLYYILLSSQ